MNDEPGSEVKDNSAINKSRGPAYPYIDLAKALEKVEQMISKGLSTKHAVPPATVYGYWGMGLKSSASRQSMAALKYFGLVEYVGTGKDRRVRLTDVAMILAHDKDENSKRRAAALREAALSPEVFQDIYSENGGPHLPPDEQIILDLTLDKQFDRDSAEKAVRNFRASIELAGLDDITGEAEIEDFHGAPDAGPLPNNQYGRAEVGDLVQWESQGAFQFPTARRVTEISPDGSFAGVEGSQTWMPITQLIVQQKEEKVVAPSAPPLTTSTVPIASVVPVASAEASHGEYKVDTYATLEGDVSLKWPISITLESVEEVEDWTKLIFKKLKREIARRERQEKPSGKIDDEIDDILGDAISET